jgi:uncharacterized membrane protein YccC
VSNLTPQQVIETLSKIARDIDEATDDIARLDEEAVRARAEFKTAFARSFLSAQGAMDIRRYTAELETADLHLFHELADQKHRAAVSQIRALRDRLEVGRSLGPLIRLEWGQS